ncbi:TROVE domain-containing protein [Paenibacillus humicus]|uniref:TROVE domain-containing protein n=1 Tax=Paenibacillus humicus TaxID=412861 RepID=UPI0035A26079
MGTTFYADQKELLEEAGQLHHEMAQSNPTFMARSLVFARQESYMRLQPLFGLAVLSIYRSDLFAKVFKQLVVTPADLADFLTVLKGMGRGEGGRAVKRQVGRFLGQISEYWAVKYNGRGRGYSIGDAIAISHPKPLDARQQALFRYLRGHEADLSLLPQVEALERLKKADSDEERLKWIGKGKLPHETVTGSIPVTRAVWEALMYQMPTFALLRNLNTLLREGILDHPENLNYVVERLTDGQALRKAKVLPFRLATAYKQVQEPRLKKALENAAELTFENLPELGDNTAIFLDISGSMDGYYLQVGSVFALAMYKKTKGKSLFWLFDTDVMDAKPSRKKGILSQAARIETRGGTDTGAPVRKLIHQRKKVDQIILITDEQQNSGSQFYE